MLAGMVALGEYCLQVRERDTGFEHLSRDRTATHHPVLLVVVILPPPITRSGDPAATHHPVLLVVVITG